MKNKRKEPPPKKNRTEAQGFNVDVTAPSAIGQIIRNMHEDVIKESEPEYGQLDDASRKAVERSHAKKTKLLWGEYLANRL